MKLVYLQRFIIATVLTTPSLFVDCYEYTTAETPTATGLWTWHFIWLSALYYKEF